MKRRNLGWLLLGGLLSSSAWAESQLNMTQGVTDVSQNVYDLHMMVMWICTVIGVVVFGAMFWSMIFHRKSKGAKPASFHESTKVEILWTAIPILILVGMAWPATNTLINMEDNSNSDITVQITGSQWKWHYKYFDQDIEFYSVLATPKSQFDNRNGAGDAKGEYYLLEVDKPLVIPVNRKVRFLITSDDVIHSWWVPAFAVKQDANPGFINEAWTKVNEPGIYRGQCAELCGKDHGFMPIVVDVRSEADYELWINEQKIAKIKAAEAEAQSLMAKASMEELMALGEQTYAAHCAACHQPTGMGLPPAFPALNGSEIANTPSKVGDHISVVFTGRSGTGMQGYGKQLSLKEIAAVITYERNAWDNNTGQAVQPADVKYIVEGTDGASITEPAAPVAAEEVEALVATAEVNLADLSMDELMSKGEEVYNTRCVACHQASGAGMPPAFPALKGSPIATGDVNAHISIVADGKAGTAMMGFAAQLSPQEMAAVITYERNAWGNSTGDMVQANDVAK